MNKLSRYLAKHNLKVPAFAARLKVAPSTIYRVLSGERECGLKLARKIEDETAGEVKASGLLAERLRTTPKVRAA
jgi:predicted transcriptional regulator